jgi:hypothetical protein
MSMRTASGAIPSSLQDWIVRRRAILSSEDQVFNLMSGEDARNISTVAGDKVWSFKNAHDYLHKVGNLAVGKKWETLMSLVFNGGAAKDALPLIGDLKGEATPQMALAPPEGILIARDFSVSEIDKEGTMKLIVEDSIIKIDGQTEKQTWTGDLREIAEGEPAIGKGVGRLFGSAKPGWRLRDRDGKYEILLRELSP